MHKPVALRSRRLRRTKAALEAAWPRLCADGTIVFDQYAVRYWGKSDVADAFLATLPRAPQLRIVLGNTDAYGLLDQGTALITRIFGGIS